MDGIAESGVDRAQYLTFHLAGEEYGARILRIREVVELVPVTRVPATPPWIRGVINLRGSVLPVLDVAVKLGLGEASITRRTCIVVVEAELDGQVTAIGLLVDSINQVVDLRPDEIEPPPAFGTCVAIDFLQGMGRAGPKFVLLLDLDAVLSPRELVAAANLAPGAEDASGGAVAAAAPPDLPGAPPAVPEVAAPLDTATPAGSGAPVDEHGWDLDVAL